MMDALTGVRALAALWVVLFHFNISPLSTLHLTRVFPLTLHGYLGVDLFFILSGFVITHVHRRDFSPWRWSAVRRFYALRLARFYPLHLFVLVGLVPMVLIGPLIGFAPKGPGHFTPALFILNLLLVQAWWWVPSAWNFPAWSVSCEWFIYLLFPWIALAFGAARNRSTVLICLALDLALFAVAYVFLFRFNVNVVDKTDIPGQALVRILFEFVAGGLLYRLSEFWDLSRAPWTLLAAAVVAVAVILGEPAIDFILVLLFCVLVSAGKYSGNAISRVLALPPLVYLGEISYSLYMVHAPIDMTVGKAAAALLADNDGLTPRAIAVALGMLGFTVAVAALTYHFVERPARSWLRRRFIDGGGHHAGPAPAPVVMRVGEHGYGPSAAARSPGDAAGLLQDR